LDELRRRCDKIIRLQHDESFDIVVALAYDFLKGETYLSNNGSPYEGGHVLMDLMTAYNFEAYLSRVIAVFNDAFSFAVRYALKTQVRASPKKEKRSQTCFKKTKKLWP